MAQLDPRSRDRLDYLENKEANYKMFRLDLLKNRYNLVPIEIQEMQEILKEIEIYQEKMKRRPVSPPPVNQPQIYQP